MFVRIADGTFVHLIYVLYMAQMFVCTLCGKYSAWNLTLNAPEMVCGRSKRVFPYHVWLPFDAKRTPFYQVQADTHTHKHNGHSRPTFLLWRPFRRTHTHTRVHNVDIVFAIPSLPVSTMLTPTYATALSTALRTFCATKVYFVLNFLAGFSLVCCILPIDLMVMSYMRYIRFQFGLLKKDLVNYAGSAEARAILVFVNRLKTPEKRFIIVYARLCSLTCAATVSKTCGVCAAKLVSLCLCFCCWYIFFCGANILRCAPPL